jgi:predicted Fe-Mo cluster-binding NifX family protein
MRVALATWNGRISPVFDVARQLLILEMRDGKPLQRKEEVLPGTDALSQGARLGEFGIDVLICGAIAQPLAEFVSSKGIRVVPFVAGEVADVIAAYLRGNLPGPAWAMPGCRGRGPGCCGGQGRQVRRTQRCRGRAREAVAKGNDQP